jgi:hypothetical protein
MNSEASVDEATESIAYDTSRGVAIVNGVRANFPEFGQNADAFRRFRRQPQFGKPCGKRLCHQKTILTL